MLVQTLEHGWQFKQLDSDAWLPVARVPTNVHLDLIDNKMCVLRMKPCPTDADLRVQHRGSLPRLQ